MDKIGLRIKNKRKVKNINLTELSEKVGVTVSCLSQIEKGKSFPSIITLKNIAEVLNTTVGELIGETELLLNNPIMKKEERKVVEVLDNETEIHLMSHHDENKKMEALSIVLQKNGETQELMKSHQGEEFLYVISGKVELHLNNKTYIMKRGDTAYYNSNNNHLLRNINSSVSKVLWIITPSNI